MACRRRHEPCRLVAHRCPDLTVEVRILCGKPEWITWQQPSCRGEVALHLRSPGRFDLPKKQCAASDWTAGNRDKQRQVGGADPARPTSWTSVFNKFRPLSDSQRVRLPRIAEGRELLHRIARPYRGELRTRIVELWCDRIWHLGRNAAQPPKGRMRCGSSRSWCRPRRLGQQEYDCEESQWTMDSHGQLLILNSRPGPRSVDACCGGQFCRDVCCRENSAIAILPGVTRNCAEVAAFTAQLPLPSPSVRGRGNSGAIGQGQNPARKCAPPCRPADLV